MPLNKIWGNLFFALSVTLWQIITLAIFSTMRDTDFLIGTHTLQIGTRVNALDWPLVLVTQSISTSQTHFGEIAKEKGRLAVNSNL